MLKTIYNARKWEIFDQIISFARLEISQKNNYVLEEILIVMCQKSNQKLKKTPKKNPLMTNNNTRQNPIHY